MKRVVLLLIIISLPLILFFAWRSYTFHIVSTNPKLTAVPNSTPYIDIMFNKQIAPQDVTRKITSSQPIVNKSEVQGKKIRVYLKGLDTQKRYTLALRDITSESGKTINQNLVMVVKYISFDKLPKDLQKAILDNQDAVTSQSEIADPILSHLPYGGLHFSLTANLAGQTKDKPLPLEARILLDKSDLSEKETAIKTYKDEVIAYIKSLNLDPNKYNITYKVIEPSIY